jgi:hypothetical protein
MVPFSGVSPPMKLVRKGDPFSEVDLAVLLIAVEERLGGVGWF